MGTNIGLFILESDAARQDWKLTGPHHTGWKVYSAFADGDLLLAGLANDVFGSSLQRSTDGGATWAAVEGAPAHAKGGDRRLKHIWQIVRGGDGRSLLAGVADAALFRSDDEGLTWQINAGLEAHPTREDWNPGAGGLCLHTIIPDAQDPARLFIAISAVGMFRSDDDGRSWIIKNEGIRPALPEEAPKYTEINRCVHKAVQDPTEPERLYQQNHTGVYRSTNAGDSWERIENGLPSWFGFSMLIHPRRPRTLYNIPMEADANRQFAGGQMRVYRTDDGGDNWRPAGKGLPERAFSGALRDAFVLDGLEPLGLYAGTTGGELFQSRDEGGSWERLPGSFPRILSVKAFAD